MPQLPAVGSRVSLRYRRPAGSVPPLTDVVGHLLSVEPVVQVRTKAGELVDIDPVAVVSVRELSHTPVRGSEIRALEHAAALAWPGTEQHWDRGWFLRAGGGVTRRANSALPLDMSAQIADLPAIVDWYAARDLTPWLALPERLLPVRTAGVDLTRVMVRPLDVSPAQPDVALASEPDAAWLAGYQREVPIDVLTAVIGGELTFAALNNRAVGRGAVTTAPDGARWLGLSSVRVAADHRRRGHARAVCEALMNWGRAAGATHAYVQVLADNDPAVTLYTSLGFRLHHHTRYVDARSL